ncbi:MAG: CDP-archaeol synthase [Nanoarchaeota archaeon]|nr:CDP-archaeol synthase [Nanoarchaeota archaeon]MBU1632365.1 CDP-archaeol synthase [Nanoarchaeota archaeon]MBU1875532.1 CDP-archaeol synthase [Nanoarchaeota archaeon]
MVMLLLIKSLYFFLPAYFANMAPVLFRWIPFLNKPINKKLFGENKTWRGMVVAVVVGSLVFWLQKIFYVNGFRSLAIIDYQGFSLMFGFLLGLGAILGDLVKSYYKRKNNLKPGKSWPPWDQLDFVIGGLLLSFFVYVPPVEVVVILLLLSPLLHVVVNYIGYLLGIRNVKF